MKLYEVKPRYVSYLMKYEPKKILSASNDKDSRKYLGIIIMKDEYKYLVPLSSPKFNKDYKIKDYTGTRLPNDFSFDTYEDRIILLKDTCTPVVYMYKKYDDGGIDLFGKLQCNNMIPVPDSEIVEVDIENMLDLKYKNLLLKQINFLRKNQIAIYKKHINPVYINRIKNNTKLGYIKYATPDFLMLEKKSKEWEEENSLLVY